MPWSWALVRVLAKIAGFQETPTIMFDVDIYSDCLLAALNTS